MGYTLHIWWDVLHLKSYARSSTWAVAVSVLTWRCRVVTLLWRWCCRSPSSAASRLLWTARRRCWTKCRCKWQKTKRDRKIIRVSSTLMRFRHGDFHFFIWFYVCYSWLLLHFGLFPFSSFLRHQLVPKLLHSSVTYLKPEQLELPLGLIGRLVLGDPGFVDQFAETVHQCDVSEGEVGQKCIDGLMQGCGNSSVLAMELPQSCTKPSVCDSIAICTKPYEIGRSLPKLDQWLSTRLW